MSTTLMSAPDWHKLSLAALQSVKTTLNRQSDALKNISTHYQEDIDTQLDMINSIGILYDTHKKGGKIVCCGIGKSYKIATKVVATLKSLTINADELHPAEALHGDLGLLRDNDCLIFFTASGNTPELLSLLPHISLNIPIVLLSCSKESKLARHPQITSLLYADLPEHLKETVIHGIPAPTVSATLSLVLADAVALALGEMVEGDHMIRKKTFSMKHPGGSIGSDLSHLNDNYNRMSSSASSVSESFGSYTSLLSLDQFRECLPSISSTTSSELDQSMNTYRMTGSANKDQSTHHQVSKSDFLSWSELDLLKNLALYDHISFTVDSKIYTCESSNIRSLYKKILGSPVGFSSMKEFVSVFTEAEGTKKEISDTV